MTTNRSQTKSITAGRYLLTFLSRRLAALGLACMPAVSLAQSADGKWRDSQQIFENVCAYCHTTGIGPELRGRGLAPESTVSKVRHGGLSMIAFRPTDFNDRELAALALWISRSAPPAKTSGRP